MSKPPYILFRLKYRREMIWLTAVLVVSAVWTEQDLCTATFAEVVMYKWQQAVVLFQQLFLIWLVKSWHLRAKRAVDWSLSPPACNGSEVQ